MDLQTVWASCASSVASKIVCYPLDTIAIQHASSTRRPIFSVPLSTYYRGMGTSIFLLTPATVIYLTTYRASKEKLLPYLGDTTWNFLAAGTISELVSSVVWTPLEVIKARLQISKTAKDGKLLPNIKDIYQKEGMRGFYRGYLMGLVVFTPYNAIWWTTYEHTKKVSPFREPFAAAALGAVAATTITTLACHPLDLLKTRYQVSTSNTIASLDAPVAATTAAATTSTAHIRKDALMRGDDHKGIKFVARNVLREAGWRGLYLGLGARLVCSVPGSLITMSVFEYYSPDRSSESEYARGGSMQEEILGT